MARNHVSFYRWMLRVGALALIAGLISIIVGFIAQDVSSLVGGMLTYTAGFLSVRRAARRLIAGGGES